MNLAVFAVLLVILPFQAEAVSCIGKDMTVWVVNGNSLTGDGLSAPDPYVVVKIGSDNQKTEVISDNANPAWWKKLQFHHVSSNDMTIDVWDADSGARGADDHLGTCIQSMFSDGSEYNDIHCVMDGKKGFVNLLYKC